MTKTYKMATKKQQVAKDIVRAAKFLGLGLFFRCNKQLHRVEFMLDASPREMQKMADLMLTYKEERAEITMHIYG